MKLCYVGYSPTENKEYVLVFTSAPKEKLWGDDWNDPYDNSGYPYVGRTHPEENEFITALVKFPEGYEFCWEVSEYISVENVNQGIMAFAFSRYDKEKPVISAQTTLEEIKGLQKIGFEVKEEKVGVFGLDWETGTCLKSY
jgi:hypothetical protein